jgi:hypothetical protein
MDEIYLEKGKKKQRLNWKLANEYSSISEKGNI